jgi:hypothetical protein
MRDELLITLARCRLIDASMLEPLLNLPVRTADSLVEEKLVAMETVMDGEEQRDIYSLTSKGESYVKNQIPQIKELYRGFVLEQDLALCSFYLRRSKTERETWITRDDLIKKHQFPGTVDGAFINANGEWEAVKTVNVKSGYEAVRKVELFLKEAVIPQISYIVFK